MRRDDFCVAPWGAARSARTPPTSRTACQDVPLKQIGMDASIGLLVRMSGVVQRRKRRKEDEYPRHERSLRISWWPIRAVRKECLSFVAKAKTNVTVSFINTGRASERCWRAVRQAALGIRSESEFAEFDAVLLQFHRRADPSHGAFRFLGPWSPFLRRR